jgi:hydrogenase expression/formation protein HypE
MEELIRIIRKKLELKGEWKNMTDDSASGSLSGKLLFTTDSYIVTPLFFPGGDIGKISICGTINDLAVMGAEPKGMSMGLVIEEGFPKETLFRIIDSMNVVSKATGVPIVTGDTKVMEHGKIDKLVINTSGVGSAERILDEAAKPGDVLIVSGGLGEHGAALLSERFGFKSNLASDCKSLIEEMRSVRGLIKQAKDVTRGGIATILNEFSERSSIQIEVNDEVMPIKPQVRSITEMLGIDPYSLASEGMFACIASSENQEEIIGRLKRFNHDAAVIGRVSEGSGVVIQTRCGKRILPRPSGVIVPRIC